jgi:uncharacterized protein (DUF488 family)
MTNLTCHRRVRSYDLRHRRRYDLHFRDPDSFDRRYRNHPYQSSSLINLNMNSINH